MMNETIEQQMKDSEMICAQIFGAEYDTFADAQRTIVTIYVPDMTISRAGISHALKKIKQDFEVEV